MEKKRCLYCDKVLKGRIDKKFCDNVCRNNFNNRLNSDSVNLIRNVHNALRKNRRILHDLGPKKVTRQKLEEEGFDFKRITGVADNEFWVYDYRYRIEEDFVIISKP